MFLYKAFTKKVDILRASECLVSNYGEERFSTEPGVVYSLDPSVKLVICVSGYHGAFSPAHCSLFYPFDDPTTVLTKIEVLDQETVPIDSEGVKACFRSFRIVEFINPESLNGRFYDRNGGYIHMDSGVLTNEPKKPGETKSDDRDDRDDNPYMVRRRWPRGPKTFEEWIVDSGKKSLYYSLEGKSGCAWLSRETWTDEKGQYHRPSNLPAVTVFDLKGILKEEFWYFGVKQSETLFKKNLKQTHTLFSPNTSRATKVFYYDEEGWLKMTSHIMRYLLFQRVEETHFFSHPTHPRVRLRKWLTNGMLHRDYGDPAYIEYEDGQKVLAKYFVWGKLSRSGGRPSIEAFDKRGTIVRKEWRSEEGSDEHPYRSLRRPAVICYDPSSGRIRAKEWWSRKNGGSMIAKQTIGPDGSIWSAGAESKCFRLSLRQKGP